MSVRHVSFPPPDKNVHPGHPYENRFEATVTGQVGKGLDPLPSKEAWRKPSKQFPKLPTWDQKETIVGILQFQINRLSVMSGRNRIHTKTLHQIISRKYDIVFRRLS